MPEQAQRCEITDKAQQAGVWMYSWEQREANYDTGADQQPLAFASGTTTVNPAVEINNAEVAIGAIVYIRPRGFVGGELWFEFQTSGAGVTCSSETVVDLNVAVFDGTTGQIIKDSIAVNVHNIPFNSDRATFFRVFGGVSQDLNAVPWGFIDTIVDNGVSGRREVQIGARTGGPNGEFDGLSFYVQSDVDGACDTAAFLITMNNNDVGASIEFAYVGGASPYIRCMFDSSSMQTWMKHYDQSGVEGGSGSVTLADLTAGKAIHFSEGLFIGVS